MAKKEKCDCPDPGLTAPFYMLTYGDMMTLLLCFFILLFAMSTLEVKKFQSRVAIMQGSLGISKLYQHAPMQQNLPAPAIKQTLRVIAQAKVSETTEVASTREQTNIPTANPDRNNDNQRMQQIQTLAMDAGMEVIQLHEELVLTLPLYGIFDKGEWKIEPEAPSVQRFKPLYAKMAKEISFLANYDISFIGHTDSLPLKPSEDGPKSNIELGFLRATAVFDFFFSQELQDRTRVIFASQGDNIPIIPNATLDSEHQKNRRVVIHLKKRQKPYVGYTIYQH